MPSLKQFNSKEEYNKWYRNYRKLKKWKIYHTEYNRKWREKNTTFKDSVRLKIWSALKKGIIKKGVCEVCENKTTEAHHDDYKKPMEIKWLCRLCHRQRDVLAGHRVN